MHLTEILGEDVFAYADKLLSLIAGNTRAEIERMGQRVVGVIEEWR